MKTQEAYELKYSSTVQRCKDLIIKKDEIEHEICRLAIEVCDPVGSKKGTGIKRYTFKQFAKSVGIHQQTFMFWLRRYQNITVKLKPEDRKKPDKGVIREMIRRGSKSTSTPKEVQERYAKVKKEMSCPEEKCLILTLKHLKTAKFNLVSSIALKKVNQDRLKEIHTEVKAINKALNAHFKEN